MIEPQENFIRESPDDARPLPETELTGWETVRFEVDDEPSQTEAG